MGKSRMVGAGVWVAAVVGLSACAHGPQVLLPTAEGEFRIGREDVVEISVWRDADLSRTVAVRPDGYLSLPLIGEVRAEGRSAVELAAEVAAKLQPYIQEPKVTVIVREVNSRRIYVTGEVVRPGTYPLRGRVSLLQAVALAGGFTDFADREGILLIRQGHGGGQYPVRYSELLAGDDRRTEVFLMPGDTVVVP
ncbi:MAG: polysaccharide biosynthesis/export family protein [Myxococcales bacterium]|nr:polysaccharide biosynthesis/export family protein [Myxococcales bacterium]